MVAKVTIAYDGSRFFGSQTQKREGKHTLPTVLNEIEKTLRKIDINSQIAAAGRTDRGVHATRQIISFEVPHFWAEKQKLQDDLQRKITKDIEIKKVEILENFHARFDAKSRKYRYLISTTKQPIFASRYSHFETNIDMDLAQKAIALFAGTHDFFHFSKRGSDEITTIRTIHKAKAYKHKDFIIFSFEANSFLRGQVRMMANAVIEVSSGKKPLEAIADQLQNKKIRFRHPAFAGGLYLTGVRY